MNKFMSIIAVMLISALSGFAEDVLLQIGTNIDGLYANDRQGYKIDFNDDGNRFVTGCNFISAVVRVYEWDSSSFSWVQMGSDIAGFGSDVAMNGNGDRIIVSNATDSFLGISGAGKVLRFDWNGTDWEEHDISLGGENEDDYYGYSIDINSEGDTIIIGAPGYDGELAQYDMGCTYIYDFSGGYWTLRKKIIGSTEGDQDGYSVSMDSSGSYVAVGAPTAYKNTNPGLGTRPGSVKTYVDHVASYTPQLPVWGENDGDGFGSAVDITSIDPPSYSSNLGETFLAVGAPSYDNEISSQGAVYTYTRTNTSNYTVGFLLTGSVEGEIDSMSPKFGESVAISQDGLTLLVGSPFSDINGMNSGLASLYRYEANGAPWIQIADDILGLTVSEAFGSSVDINKAGNKLAIGAYLNDDNGNNAGQVRVYERKSLTSALADLKSLIYNLTISLNSLVLNNDAISDNTAGRIENANNISINQSNIASNEVDIQSVSAQAASNNASIASHDSDFDNIAEQISSNEVDIQSVSAQAASNSAAIASHDSDFDNIEAQMNSVSNILTTSVNNVINLQGALANLLNLEVDARKGADATLSNRLDIVENVTNGAISTAQAKAMMKDLRAGSTIIDVDEGVATLSLTLEKTDNIEGSNWTAVAEAVEVDLPVTNNVEFFRFRMD